MKQKINLSLLISFYLTSFLLQANLSFSKTLEYNTYNMKNIKISKQGKLIIAAAITSTFADFNFLMGEHVVKHRKLKDRLVNSKEWIKFRGTHTMERLLHGTANIERHYMKIDSENEEGITFRTFNSDTKLWSIYWAGNKSGKLDEPVLGSFENNVGTFIGEDSHEGKPVYVKFRWNAVNPLKPVWSQAFSADKGRTWEWNWHMHFSKVEKNENIKTIDIPKKISVIELRNYILKPGMRDSFINYFEDNLILTQYCLNGYPLGQYRVKGLEENFFWIRGFENMKQRSTFLPAFYLGPTWKKYKKIPNSLLANNDNVNLLHPLELENDSLVLADAIESSLLMSRNGITVIDFYTANTKLDLLKALFARNYLPLIRSLGLEDYTLWISEPQKNDFPQLPVFQDKNLLVMITHYKNELNYTEQIKSINTKMSESLRSDLMDAITIKNTLILYPTDKTINQKVK